MSGPTIAELQLKISAQGLSTLQEIERSLRSIGAIRLRGVAREFGAIQTAAERARKAVGGGGAGGAGNQSLGGAFSGLVGGIAKFGIAAMTVKRSFDMIAGGIEGALRPAIDFQKALAEVRIKGGFSAGETNMIGEGIKGRIRQGSMFSAQQQAEAGVDLAASGLSSRDVNSMLPTVLRFAQAGDLKTLEASKILTNVANMFGIKTGDTAQMEALGSKLVKSANMSTVDVKDIYNTLKYVGTQSNTAGMSPDTVLAMTAILGNRGVTGSKSGTGLRNIFTAMTRPPRRGKSIAALNRQLGLTQADAQKGMENVPGFFQDLGRRYDRAGFSKAQRLGANAMYFGQYGSTTSDIIEKATHSDDVGKAVRGNLKKDAKGNWLYDEKNAVEEYTKAIHEAGNAMKDAADIAGGTMAAKLAVFQNKWDLLKVTIGERFFPAITKGLSNLSKLVDRWESGINKNPKAFESIIKSTETFAKLLPLALETAVNSLTLMEPFLKMLNAIAVSMLKVTGYESPEDKEKLDQLRKQGKLKTDDQIALDFIRAQSGTTALGKGLFDGMSAEELAEKFERDRGAHKGKGKGRPGTHDVGATQDGDLLTGQSTVGIKLSIDQSGELKAIFDKVQKGRGGPDLRLESSVNL